MCETWHGSVHLQHICSVAQLGDKLTNTSDVLPCKCMKLCFEKAENGFTFIHDFFLLWCQIQNALTHYFLIICSVGLASILTKNNSSLALIRQHGM